MGSGRDNHINSRGAEHFVFGRCFLPLFYNRVRRCTQALARKPVSHLLISIHAQHDSQVSISCWGLFSSLATVESRFSKVAPPLLNLKITPHRPNAHGVVSYVHEPTRRCSPSL